MSMYDVLSWSDREKWKGYLDQLPLEQQDVYYLPEYVKLYEDMGSDTAHCFVYRDKGEIALYPFLKSRINDLGYDLDKEYFDIQGAYGYNGVACTTDDPDFIQGLAVAWNEWCKQETIIAEFIRYNPVLQNENLCLWAPPIETLDNVLLHLTTYEDIWNYSYDREVRSSVNKARQFGLTFSAHFGADITSTQFDFFQALYLHTMQRRNASSFYLFSDQYYQSLRDTLSENLFIGFAYYDGKPISADMYLHSGINAYGFLSGTLEDYYFTKPNRFLRDEGIKALLASGFKYLSMGGGMSRDDSTYKYKKAFSMNLKSLFYIGKCIHDLVVYDEILRQWTLRLKGETGAFKHLTLKYRFGISDPIT
ncbi:MAG: GNAT family N-acetyltransferase [Candidatus Cloacimonetes bacterium]|nr:GNAT family N-acetyltransferase [Candidatus Cloacimonadota bacterium]